MPVNLSLGLHIVDYLAFLYTMASKTVIGDFVGKRHLEIFEKHRPEDIAVYVMAKVLW